MLVRKICAMLTQYNKIIRNHCALDDVDYTATPALRDPNKCSVCDVFPAEVSSQLRSVTGLPQSPGIFIYLFQKI